MLSGIIVLAGFVFMMDLLFISAAVFVAGRIKRARERKEVLSELARRKEGKAHEGKENPEEAGSVADI